MDTIEELSHFFMNTIRTLYEQHISTLKALKDPYKPQGFIRILNITICTL